MPSLKKLIRAVNVRRHRRTQYKEMVGYRWAKRWKVFAAVLTLALLGCFYISAQYGLGAVLATAGALILGVALTGVSVVDSMDRGQHILRLHDALPSAAERMDLVSSLNHQDFYMFYAMLTSRVGGEFLAANHRDQQPPSHPPRLRLISPD